MFNLWEGCVTWINFELCKSFPKYQNFEHIMKSHNLQDFKIWRKRTFINYLNHMIFMQNIIIFLHSIINICTYSTYFHFPSFISNCHSPNSHNREILNSTHMNVVVKLFVGPLLLYWLYILIMVIVNLCIYIYAKKVLIVYIKK